MLTQTLPLTAALLVLAACGVPTDKYDAVVSERDALQESRRQLQERHDLLAEQYEVLKDRNDELEAANNELRETNRTLVLKNESLAAQNKELGDRNDELEAANSELGETNKALVLEKEALMAENKGLADKNESLAAKNKDLSDRNDELEAKNEGLESEIARLGEQNGILVTQVADLEAEVSGLGESLEEVENERDALEAELAELKPLVDDEALQLEIEELRQERDQLLDAIDRIRVAAFELAGSRQAFWAGLQCTGSREPFIDCGDVGIYLADPEIGDIEVGDVIDFPEHSVIWYSGEPTCFPPALPYEGTYIVHRVIARKVEGDTAYYQTKGDANVDADPCWISHEMVQGKLIKVLEDVRPEDVIDTSEYDAALEKYRTLRRRYNELKAVYGERKAYYMAVEMGYQSGDYSHGSYYAAWKSLEEARLELNEIVPLLNEAADELERIEAETFGE